MANIISIKEWVLDIAMLDAARGDIENALKVNMHEIFYTLFLSEELLFPCMVNIFIYT